MTAKKKIYILLGNPITNSLTGHMADIYEMSALKAGHEVRRQNIGEMKFDPILHNGYHTIQELEADLKTFQANVRWADHIVILYPNWWATMPALLKGLIDRAWLPGFAFHFHPKGTHIPGWTPLLKGKTARTIIFANMHPVLTWLLFGNFTNELARATLGFSGIRPVNIKVFTPSETASKEKIAKWSRHVARLGATGR